MKSMFTITALVLVCFLASSASFASVAKETPKLSGSCETRIRELAARMLAPWDGNDTTLVEIKEVTVSDSHLDERSGEMFASYKVEVNIPAESGLSGEIIAEDVRHGCAIYSVNIH